MSNSLRETGTELVTVDSAFHDPDFDAELANDVAEEIAQTFGLENDEEVWAKLIPKLYLVIQGKEERIQELLREAFATQSIAQLVKTLASLAQVSASRQDAEDM